MSPQRRLVLRLTLQLLRCRRAPPARRLTADQPLLTLNWARQGRASGCATLPRDRPVPQSFTATPHGKLSTATDLVTLSASTSITEMSFETPFVV